MTIRLRLILILVVWIVATACLAQAPTCTQTLRLARTTYQQGRLHELPSLLASCINSGFTKEERTEAYELLTLAYIYLEEPEKADEAMLGVLNTDHFYEVNPEVDPAEFVALYKKFRTRPLYRIGARFGITGTTASPTSNSFVSINSPGNGTYSSGFSFQGAFVFEKDLTAKFIIAPELGYTIRTYDYSNPQQFVYDSATSTSVVSTQATFNQTWIDLSLLVQYRILLKSKNLIPYVAAGPGISYLLSASGSLLTSEVEGAFVVSGPDIDIKNSFNTLAYSAIVAAGIKYKVGGVFLTAEARYQFGLVNVVNPESRSNLEVVFDYATTFNNVRQNNFGFSLGVLYPYFKPRKLIR